MPTFTAFTTLKDQARAEALGVAMERLTPEPVGIGVIEVEDGSGHWEVGGYFEAAPDETALALLAAAWGAATFVVSELPETDWVAHVKRTLAPVEAGRFFVYGSHDADRVPEGRIALLIEAAMAFGTGHHGTTQGCLLALDQLLENRITARRVADIGCGTAVLAMAAARVFTHAVIATDNDPQAVEVARANAAANGLHARVICETATGFEHPLHHQNAPYDLVFANILKMPLIELAPDMARFVAPGGRVILSGILTTQAVEVETAYAAQGFVAEKRLNIGEWTTLTLLR